MHDIEKTKIEKKRLGDSRLKKNIFFAVLPLKIRVISTVGEKKCPIPIGPFTREKDLSEPVFEPSISRLQSRRDKFQVTQSKWSKWDLKNRSEPVFPLVRKTGRAPRRARRGRRRPWPASRPPRLRMPSGTQARSPARC